VAYFWGHPVDANDKCTCYHTTQNNCIKVRQVEIVITLTPV